MKARFVAALLCVVSLSAWAQAPVPVTPAMEQKVDALIARMSLDDKLALIGGEDSFYTRAVPSIGLKRFKMSDGPVGVRTFGQTTAYTAGVALAASWDPELARRVGSALGQDARARGVNFLLAPGVNIYRSPLNGRNMEYFGEDPYLAGRMAVGYIEGVQSQGVSATVKHFAANNSEYDRHRINTFVDERTLRELYLPAFEAAVKEAHVGAVMDSYNLVNGEHSTQNGHLNNEILKKEWDFQGVLMSDWDATYDAVRAANGGLDLEMPWAKLMTPEALKAALKDGKLSQATLDDKVRRILRTAMQFGWMDRDQWDTTIPLNNPAGDRVALEEARESITLLKNDGALLPLDTKKVRTIAVIGPMAARPVVGGGGSSNTTPFDADSISVAFAKYLGERVKVLYVPGIPDAAQLVRETHFKDLKMDKSALPSTPSVARGGSSARAAHDQIDLQARNDASGPTGYHWTGQYVPAKTAPYLVMVNAQDTDSYSLKVNGKEVLSHNAGDGYRSNHQLGEHVVLPMTEAQAASVELTFDAKNGQSHVSLAVVPQDELFPKESRKMLVDADAVLVAVGFDAASEGEGFDRTYRMPGPQDELVAEVAKLNPKTIVAVTAGGAVETASWIGNVPALLTLYYPGQEGARALAEIVFGERSPEGRLPFSWETKLADNPASTHYAEEPGDGRVVHYAEGLMLGYRYYTTEGKKPLFPFGYGMSYTTFAYSGLKVTKVSADDVEVAFDVENKGSHEGATVAQVYVGDPSATVKRPVMELKQFAKVRLKPGAKQHVTLRLNQRAFEYYNVASKGWKMDPGAFTVMVGESSEAIVLKAPLTM